MDAVACISASALASNIGINNGSSGIVVSKRRAWL